MKFLEQTMRWYGPNDTVPLQHIRQAGATGIVTSLHHVEIGTTWSKEEIQYRKEEIARAGMRWSVVESVNVHEAIKTGVHDRDKYIQSYRDTLIHLAESGINTVCYNFMPVLDWSRSDLKYQMADGSEALRFEWLALIAFDVFLLKRPAAEKDYQPEELEQAAALLESLDEASKKTLIANVTMGLPGSARGYTLEEVREKIEPYQDIDAATLKKNLHYFISNIIEVAEQYNIRLSIHPDDPPFPLLGLPRVVSTENDARELIQAVPSPSNGLCLCTGSYGVRADNDLPGMARRLASHIHFIHLRNIRREGNRNFYEADHLDGETDMYEVMVALSEEQQKREAAIPMRPDHGHAMLDDLSKITNPGYTAIGRLRGLAELRGLELGIVRSMGKIN